MDNATHLNAIVKYVRALSATHSSAEAENKSVLVEQYNDDDEIFHYYYCCCLFVIVKLFEVEVP